MLPAIAAADRALGTDTAVACAALSGAGKDVIKIDVAGLTEPTPLMVAEKGPTPAGGIDHATPQFCGVLGHIEPSDPKAQPILFQLNLPLNRNGRTMQYGGGFNGVVITCFCLPPAAPFNVASPLARGFATYGTDSNYEAGPG